MGSEAVPYLYAHAQLSSCLHTFIPRIPIYVESIVILFKGCLPYDPAVQPWCANIRICSNEKTVYKILQSVHN